MISKYWIAAFVLLAGPLTNHTPTMAQDRPVQLKLSHWVPPQHPIQAAIQDWADDVKKASGGTITSVIFPAEQLGKAFDHYDMARDGIADFTYINPGYQPGRFPIIAAGELPFLFGDAKAGTGALDAWYRTYARAEMKDVHVCFAFINELSTIHSKTQITVPGDIKGLKLRPADATMGALTTLLHGNNVQASAPGARDLLERGVADGIYFPYGSLVLFGMDRLTKYHLDIPLYATTFAWVMNQRRYDALAPAQRQVIDDHCTTEWAIRFASPWVDFEHAGLAKVKNAPGQVMTPLSAGQVEQWQQAAQPLQAAWAEGARKAGVDPDAAFQALRTELTKFKAAY
jgi:TRAP-type C4-dicarboxylate transport system substrate-binding protein